MVVATLVTFLYPGMTQLRADRAGDVRRRRARLVERQARGDDRHAADDRALQRHGRRRGGGDRGGRAVPRRDPRLRGQHARRGRRPDRRGVLQRQRCRLRQAAGADQAQPALWRPAAAEPAAARGGGRARGDDRRAPERSAHGGDGPVPGRAAARADDDAADRRRRHAGGDLALQRAHRAGGRLRGFRAQQRRDDHRRHRGRLGRHAAHAADGQGHEPLARQRAVLGLRRHRWRGHGHRSRGA